MPNLLSVDRQVATYVPAELAKAIDAAALADGLSRAAFVRTMLAKAMAKRAESSPTPVGDK